MKTKHALIIGLMLLMTFWSFRSEAQTPIQQKKAEFYAAEAIKYFKLDESKKDDIYQAKLELIQAQSEMNKKKKSGELKEADLDLYRKNNVQPYAKNVMKAIGVKWPELKPFNEKVHPKMNKLKI